MVTWILWGRGWVSELFPYDLTTLPEQARAARDSFEVLRYMLEADEADDATIDAWVDEVAAPVIAGIDCTQCANCCNSLQVYLEAGDAERLAEGLGVSAAEVEARYVDREAAAELEEWGCFRYRPCVFLQGKRCGLYAHRPESCRAYPMMTPDFRWTMEDGIDGAAICPIIYHTFLRLAEQIDDWQRSRSINSL